MRGDVFPMSTDKFSGPAFTWELSTDITGKDAKIIVIRRQALLSKLIDIKKKPLLLRF